MFLEFGDGHDGNHLDKIHLIASPSAYIIESGLFVYIRIKDHACSGRSRVDSGEFARTLPHPSPF